MQGHHQIWKAVGRFNRHAKNKEGAEMKKQAYTMIAMIVLVGSMAVAAQAQDSGHTKLIANIPFQFNVGEKMLPAGEYTVTQVNPDSDRVVLQLRSKDVSVVIQMDRVIGKQEGAKLTFNRYGNQYFFAQAWTGQSDGLQAGKSRTERSIARELAGNTRKPETIALRTRR
jgi:hypothetical protein